MIPTYLCIIMLTFFHDLGFPPHYSATVAIRIGSIVMRESLIIGSEQGVGTVCKRDPHNWSDEKLMHYANKNRIFEGKS